MRSFQLVSPALLAIAVCQIPVFADGTSVGVCNGGKAEFDAYLVTGSVTYTKHVNPIECVYLAQSDGQMPPAMIGFAFTDPKGQYAGARRFDVLPNWNSPLDAQFGLPVVMKQGHTTLTVKHGAASVTILGLLAFQAQPEVCTVSPPPSHTPIYLGMSARQIADIQFTDSLRANSSPQEKTCHFPGYALTAIAYPDTHEVSLVDECYACQAAEQAKLTPEQRAKDEETQKSIDEGLRRLVATFSFGGANGLGMKDLMDQTLKDDEAAPARRAEMAKGPYSMDWEHLSTFVVSAFSRAKPLMYNRHIILRGTISRVVPPKQGAEIPRYVVYFKEGSTLTKAPMNLPGDYFIQQYVGREDAFAICAVDGAVLGDVFGAGYATSAVGKLVEMEGELNSGTCSAAVGIHVDLAHQMKVVTASTPATKGQTFTPKFGPAPAGPGPAAPISDLGTQIGNLRDNAAAAAAVALLGGAGPPAASDAGRAATTTARTTREPATTASVTPARPIRRTLDAPVGPTIPPAPAAPKRDPLIDDVLNRMRQGVSPAGIITLLKQRQKAVTLTDADKAELKASGATDAVIAALLDPSKIPLTPEEQRMAAQQVTSREAAQKLGACLQKALEDHGNDRQAYMKAQQACGSSR
jgi:hypothetical protein